MLDAVDLLLERRDHGRGHDLGAGAGIDRRHGDDGFLDLRIFADVGAEKALDAEQQSSAELIRSLAEQNARVVAQKALPQVARFEKNAPAAQLTWPAAGAKGA